MTSLLKIMIKMTMNKKKKKKTIKTSKAYPLLG